jgi:hypothetical protein
MASPRNDGDGGTLFVAEPRAAQQSGLALLTPRDIVEMLKATLPHKPEGKDALVARINQRHERRRSAMASRFHAQRREAPSRNHHAPNLTVSN